MARAPACIRLPLRLRIGTMTGLLILVALAIPYLVLNVRRLLRGRAWAFSFCQLAKEWEERERAKRLAARRPPPRRL